MNPHNRGPLRTLSVLILLVIGLYGLLGAVSTWGEAQLTPKLGLDLEGGTQMILKPKATSGQAINEDQVQKAVDIIRARVDGSGVVEAEVTTQGDNIVVSLPGEVDTATRESLQKSSQLQMRAVLVAVPTDAAIPPPAPAPTTTGPAGSKPTAPATSKPKATGAQTTAPKSGFPPALSAVTNPSPTGAPSPTKVDTAPLPKPKDGSDLAWVTPELQKSLTDLDCTNSTALTSIVEDRTKPMVTCDTERPFKYILGPAEVLGSEIKNATSGPEVGQTGAATGQFEVKLEFNGAGTKSFCDVSSRLVSLPSPRNQFGIVLDNQVISAPESKAALCAGSASITGNFTAASSKVLADQLKFGALPMSFGLQTDEKISPTLGGDQLARGLLAGGIGLLLVVGYSLFQYRALGLVTVSSLIVAGAITYAAVTLFGWSHEFRLTMAGVTGLIVAIGITADSFIIYFERVRDEVRDGRALRAAVETGWSRARRTILISDTVNFLAAIVLYALAASNVRGFAFTLMLTTVVDIIVVMLFTHPLLSFLANTKFFGEGHKWSGLDPQRLGAKTVTYAGRGRVTIAARKAATEGSQS